MKPITDTERTCADCHTSYSPMLGPGGRMPRGYKICPICKSVNTEFLDRLHECGSCGAFHRKRYSGDCRNDGERFPIGNNPLPEIEGLED